jgi:hypothetical protein
MTDLSANEVELLYAIKNDQGRTLTFYGDELRKHYTQLTRTLERLKLAGYVQASENNRLYISDAFQQRQQAAPEPDPEPETVVEVVELAPVVDVPEAQPVLKTEPAPVYEAGMKITREMIVELLADGVARSAGNIAQHYGHSKGTVIGQQMRMLMADGAVLKDGLFYTLSKKEAALPKAEPITVEKVVEQQTALAEIIRKPVEEVAQETEEPVVAVAEESEADDDLAARLIAVLEKDVPQPLVEFAAEAHEEKPRGNLPTLFSGELQNHILKKRSAFTATEIMLDFAESHYIDKDRFMEIFEDVACSGDLMCWDNGEFLDPELEYVPGSQYIVLRKTEPTDAIAIMDEYCENIRAPYKLFDIVETTHIHHADVARYLVDFDYDLTDLNCIVKGPHTTDVAYSQKTAVSASPKAGTFPPKAGTYPVKSGYQGKEYKPFKPKADRDTPLISYALIENLNPKDISDFLDGGVKLDVFIRKFNLHPDDKKHIVEVLTLTGVAELTDVAGVEWVFLKGCNDTPAQEGRVTTLLDLDPSLPETVPSESALQQKARGHSGDVSLLMKDALDLIVDSEEDKLEKIGVLRDAILEAGMSPSTVFMSHELADELQVPITECTCDFCKVFGVAQHADDCPLSEIENDLLRDPADGPESVKGPNGPSEKTGHYGERLLSPGVSVNEGMESFGRFPPDPQWLLTLKMLEERLRFEHQGTTADQLHEIRKYLEP